MSNPYLNNILFGNSKMQVDEDYVRGLEEFMLTEDRLKMFTTKQENASPIVENTRFTEENSKSEIFKRCDSGPSQRHPQKNSLFWSIYEIENPKEAFMGTRANAEVENRLKVVASLKQTPKRLKETNSKLTIEKTQALIGSMLVAKEDQLDFCIAYAVYYCKPIVVVYPKTYRVFSPTVDVDLADEDVILLYASKPEYTKTVFYESEKNATPELIAKIVETRIRTPLNAQSSYKAPELDAIAAKLQIATTTTETGKEKRRKKEDIYNDILVATHSDSHFVKNSGCEAVRVQTNST